MNHSKSKSKSRSKTRTATNTTKSANKSRKISQKKAPGENTSKKSASISKDSHANIKTYRDLTSPKTIEYSKSENYILICSFREI